MPHSKGSRVRLSTAPIGIQEIDVTEESMRIPADTLIVS
jgi:hypothetical protein